MRIQNFSDLATSSKKQHCLEILEAGLDVADPEKTISKYFTKSQISSLSHYSKIYLVAFGKAGDSMSRAVNDIIPVQGGIIVIPKGSKSLIKGKKFQIFNSGHPIPNRTSVQAAKEIIKFLKNRRHDDLVIFLVSGGASALVALPDGITLDDKIQVSKLLLKSGATIQEFNCVRKHLSKIKGGKLVSNLKCDAFALVMSDVEGDDLSSIASGITYRDDSTYDDAINVIQKYNLVKKIPKDALKALENGKDYTIKEIPNYIIANNSVSILEMQQKAEQLGYKTQTIQIFGDIKDAVKKIILHIPKEDNHCLIFGGEPTVKVLGKGIGGRNHELVLRILKNTQKFDKLVIASIGTDGIDGNTNFAGAITENFKIDSSIIKEFLKNSDSAKFFQKRKSNILTGFTHTNLMDIGLILR